MTSMTHAYKTAAGTEWTFTMFTRPLFFSLVVLFIAQASPLILVSTATKMVAYALIGILCFVTVMFAYPVLKTWDASIYTVLVAISTAVFLSGVVAYGPSIKWTLVGLVLPTLVLGLAYGPIERRRDHYNAQAVADIQVAEFIEEQKNLTEADKQTMWERILTDAGFTGMRELRQEEHPAGYTTVITHEDGKVTTAQLEPIARNLESIAAVRVDIENEQAGYEKMKPIRRFALEIHASDRPNETRILIDEVDALARTVTYDMANRGPQTINEPKILGFTKENTPHTDVFVGRNKLIVGTMGAGKSVMANNMIAKVSECADTVIMVTALDKGPSLVAKWMKPYLLGETKNAVIWPALTKTEAIHQLLWAYEKLDRRESAPRGGKDKVTPSPRMPLILHLIEESPTFYAISDQVLTYKNERITVQDLAIRVLRMQRSLAGATIALSQSGVSDFLMPGGGAKGTQLARLLQDRYGFQVPPGQGNGETMALFGRKPMGYGLDELPHKGTYLNQVGHGQIIIAKSQYLDSETDFVETLAARHGMWAAQPEGSGSDPVWDDRFSNERFGETREMLLRFLADPDDNDRGFQVFTGFGGKVEESGESADDQVASWSAGKLPELPDVPTSWATAAQDQTSAEHEAEEDISDADIARMLAEFEQLLAEQPVDQRESFQSAVDALTRDSHRIVLLKLFEAGSGGMKVKDLVDGVNYSRAAVNTALDALQAMGLVRKIGHGVYVAVHALEE